MQINKKINSNYNNNQQIPFKYLIKIHNNFLFKEKYIFRLFQEKANKIKFLKLICILKKILQVK